MISTVSIITTMEQQMATEDTTPEKGDEGFTDEGLLAAVSDAVDEVTIVEETQEGEDDGDELPTNSESEASDDGDEKVAPGGESEDEEAGPADGEAGETAVGDVAAAADGKKDEGTKGDADTAVADPVNDPIPDALAEPTKKRIRSLIEITKERTVEANQGKEIIAAVAAAGADPEQFANTVSFLSLYNSKDPTTRKQALEVARGVVRELALELGEGASVINLTAHKDLVAEVEAGTLTEERAVEIATGREQKALQQSRSEHAQAQQDSKAQTEANIQRGRNQLNTFEATVKGVDPGYEALRPTLIRVLTPTLRHTHPSEWGTVAKEIYQNLKSAMPAPTPIASNQPPKNTPLRPKGHGGGGSSKETGPKSAVEAMNRALEGM